MKHTAAHSCSTADSGEGPAELLLRLPPDAAAVQGDLGGGADAEAWWLPPAAAVSDNGQDACGSQPASRLLGWKWTGSASGDAPASQVSSSKHSCCLYAWV